MANYTDQTSSSWVRDYGSVITIDDGTFDSGTDGFALK